MRNWLATALSLVITIPLELALIDLLHIPPGWPAFLFGCMLGATNAFVTILAVERIVTGRIA